MSSLVDLRADAAAILKAGVAAAEPGAAVRRALSLSGETLLVGNLPPIPLAPGGRILLTAAGKAAPAMSAAAVERLGDHLTAGTMTAPATAEDGTLPSILGVWNGGHPLPTIGGMAGAGEALALARSAGADDLLLCLLSGGASSLWSAPAPGLSLDDLRAAGDALLRSGAPIEAVNTVRAHLSAIAGGRLAAAAAPARVVTLAISDVVGAPPSAIGSGPTLPDPLTYADALEVVARHQVELPTRALHHLRAGAAGLLPETPDAEALPNLAGFVVVLSVKDALAGAAAAAEHLGYRVVLDEEPMSGEARDVGVRIAAAGRNEAERAEQPLALLRGGETTVTVRGGGRGGRNQELALAAAFGIEGEARIVIAAAGTDGRDGPTDAAGAIVDGGTLARGRTAGFDPSASLTANDAYTFLQATGDLLKTGPSGTNVNDLVLTLITPRQAAG